MFNDLSNASHNDGLVLELTRASQVDLDARWGCPIPHVYFYELLGNGKVGVSPVPGKKHALMIDFSDIVRITKDREPWPPEARRGFEFL